MERPSIDSATASFGEQLRLERIRRRLTIGQASADTRIREPVLRAVEDGEINRLPSVVFACGLIRTYCRYLNYDPAPYVAAVTAASPETFPRPHGLSVSPLRHRPPRLPSVVIAFATFAIIVGLSMYLYRQYESFAAGSPIVQVRSSATSVATTAIGSTPTGQPTAISALVDVPNPSPATPVPSPTARAPTAVPATSIPVQATPIPVPTASVVPGVHIAAITSGRVWMQVETDGNVVFSGTLNSGERRTWNATGKLFLWSGNAGNVDVTYNGKSLGRLGAPGEVVKVTWTATS